MSISINSQIQYTAVMRNSIPNTEAVRKSTGISREQSAAASYSTYLADRAEEEKANQARELRQQLRELKRSVSKEQNENSTQDRIKTLFEQSAMAEKEDDDKVEKPVNYNSKEVESKIRQAKTSTSAGKAVITAKRKVLEMQRKIAAGDGDPEELQLALTHAKRMEMVAKKKKHHLEQEELAQITQKRDERYEQQEEAANELKNSMVSAEEEKISKQEDAIFDERQKQISDTMDEIRESGAKVSDEMIADLNKLISEIGEDELKELEEAMEMLENMEIIDPHMSKEDLEDLKRKHRASEEKALIKADLDYLKGMVKHHMDISASMPGMSAGMSPAASAMPSFNVQV